MDAFPDVIVEEHDFYDKTGICLKTEGLNRAFKFQPRLKKSYPPCFFAGDIDNARYCLLGLNPGFNQKRNWIERKVYKEKGWEQTYRTFFSVVR